MSDWPPAEAEKLILSERDSLRVLDLLDNPPEPPERLTRAAKALKRRAGPTAELQEEWVEAVRQAKVSDEFAHLDAELNEQGKS
ncbi:MAG: DUF1778 domain-containing protein [Methylocystis silviterrae]|uniref:type II toxin -antitoxin system TacA 1-like antitoxin n=1 Tax=Methylocystis silviterrae TaxID=2743612 RepID=UPI003C758097